MASAAYALKWMRFSVVAGYVALCMLPLAIALPGATPPSRGFGVELGIALGFVGLAMMGMQFVLTARFPSISRRIGQDTLLQFHKFAGLIAAGFVIAHPIVLIAADARFASFFDPRVNLPRAFALSMVNVALLALIGLSLLRAKWAIQYEWWRLMHAALAALIMLIAMAHVIMVDRYSQPLWKKVAFIALIAGPVLLLLHVRLLRPLLNARRRWRVAGVRQERERIWTITLEAVDHDGLRFESGQFAWLTFGPRPIALKQHPFTIASSASQPRRLEFTIKQLGDFTSTIGSMAIGTTVHIDGPAGSFVPPADANGLTLISGGIGITPMMSILRSMRDIGDQRPVTLIYANQTLEKAVFAGELDALAREITLRIEHVPEIAPDRWQGHTGYITRAMLEAQVPAADRSGHAFMICGPDAMMDAVERALLDMGVGRERIRAERFNVI